MQQVVSDKEDTPIIYFNVTVEHEPDSKYDAYDVTASDMTLGMDIHAASVVPKKDLSIQYPKYNTYILTLKRPKLRGKYGPGNTSFWWNRTSFWKWFLKPGFHILVSNTRLHLHPPGAARQDIIVWYHPGY